MENEQIIKEIMHQKNCDRETAIAILNGAINLDSRGVVVDKNVVNEPETKTTETKSKKKK